MRLKVQKIRTTQVCFGNIWCGKCAGQCHANMGARTGAKVQTKPKLELMKPLRILTRCSSGCSSQDPQINQSAGLRFFGVTLMSRGVTIVRLIISGAVGWIEGDQPSPQIWFSEKRNLGQINLTGSRPEYEGFDQHQEMGCRLKASPISTLCHLNLNNSVITEGVKVMTSVMVQ